MIGYDEATRRVAALARPLGTEHVPLSTAHGRILAAPVRARVTAPRTDVSAMDGYAVREADVAEVPSRLAVVGEAFPARAFPHRLLPGRCVRIFTGAPLPPGADRVIVQEVVRREGEAAVIVDPPAQGRHVRKRGSDFEEGSLLLEAGHLLNARALVAVAAADVGAVEVWRRPRVAVLSTGDELAEPGQAAGRDGFIPESVSFGVAALAEQWGATLVASRRLPDALATMEQAAAEALEASDLVVVTGGASVGAKDFARPMFESRGLELAFSKVSIKPGKPVWLGRVEGRIVLGLPGNPTSALVTARLLLAPLIAGLSGRKPAAALAWRDAPLAEALEPCGDRETFYRAAWEGRTVLPLFNQESGSQRALVAADVLVRRRAGAPASAPGDVVEVLDF